VQTSDAAVDQRLTRRISQLFECDQRSLVGGERVLASTEIDELIAQAAADAGGQRYIVRLSQQLERECVLLCCLGMGEA